MPQRRISILGCGWLGLPLAELLTKNNYHIKGSTTTPAKLSLLKQKDIVPYHLVSQPELCGERVKEFFESEILFLNIPFKRNLPRADIYRQQIQSVAAYLKDSPVKKVIFASSTSIYPESNGPVDETTPIDQSNERARVLFEIEQELLSLSGLRCVVIRFAGLFGPGRAIGSFLRKVDKEKLSNAPVNLIHLQDCLGIIEQIIKQDISGVTLNACCDEHPLRKDLYARFLSSETMKSVVFIEPQENSFKIVSNSLLKRTLQYKLVYPNPLTALSN